MAIFNSYVKLPEGNRILIHHQVWCIVSDKPISAPEIEVLGDDFPVGMLLILIHCKGGFSIVTSKTVAGYKNSLGISHPQWFKVFKVFGP